MQPNYNAIYRALVTSNTDATNSGKIRVQCPQIAGLAEIRSAEPVNPQQPIPSVGTIVWLMFSGGMKPTGQALLHSTVQLTGEHFSIDLTLKITYGL
jgi:hypothetical protein